MSDPTQPPCGGKNQPPCQPQPANGEALTPYDYAKHNWVCYQAGWRDLAGEVAAIIPQLPPEYAQIVEAALGRVPEPPQ
jgi:hypothetical protein